MCYSLGGEELKKVEKVRTRWEGTSRNEGISAVATFVGVVKEEAVSKKRKQPSQNCKKSGRRISSIEKRICALSWSLELSK